MDGTSVDPGWGRSCQDRAVNFCFYPNGIRTMWTSMRSFRAYSWTYGSTSERNMLRSSFVSENVDDTRNRTVRFVSSVTCEVRCERRVQQLAGYGVGWQDRAAVGRIGRRLAQDRASAGRKGRELRSSFVSENVDDTRNRTVRLVSSVTCQLLAR